MTQETIKILAKQLDDDNEITFHYNDLSYRIYWSFTEGGWMIDIIKDDKIIDGGLCTGSTEDTIEFMLKEENGTS